MGKEEENLQCRYPKDKLVEVQGSVWDAARLASISVGVGSLLLKSYQGFTASEQSLRLERFYAKITDLSRGRARSAQLSIKGGFIGLSFSESLQDPGAIVVYDDDDQVYTVDVAHGGIDYAGDITRVRGFTPFTFCETKPQLELCLFPRNLNEKLLHNGANDLQDTLTSFAAYVLELYGDLQTDALMQALDTRLRTIIRHEFGDNSFTLRSLLSRRVVYSFSFSGALREAGTIQVLAEPISGYRFLKM